MWRKPEGGPEGGKEWREGGCQGHSVDKMILSKQCPEGIEGGHTEGLGRWAFYAEDEHTGESLASEALEGGKGGTGAGDEVWAVGIAATWDPSSLCTDWSADREGRGCGLCKVVIALLENYLHILS